MRPRQVQDFIPTPMAIATTMFYTGIDPLTMEPVYTATDLREKSMMKALLYWWDPEQRPLAREALHKAGREGPHRAGGALPRAPRLWGHSVTEGERAPRPRPNDGTGERGQAEEEMTR